MTMNKTVPIPVELARRVMNALQLKYEQELLRELSDCLVLHGHQVVKVLLVRELTEGEDGEGECSTERRDTEDDSEGT